MHYYRSTRSSVIRIDFPNWPSDHFYIFDIVIYHPKESCRMMNELSVANPANNNKYRRNDQPLLARISGFGLRGPPLKFHPGRKIINPSGGYPPDIHRISTLIGPGGYPPEGFMILRPRTEEGRAAHKCIYKTYSYQMLRFRTNNNDK